MQRWFAFSWPFIPALLAPIGTMDSAGGSFVVSAYLVNALLIIVATPLLVGLHECAHAAAGALLGGRVRRIQVGSGRKLASFTVAGISVQLCARPAGGLTWVAPPSGGRFLRLREWLWTLAGPASDLAVVALIVVLVRPDDPPLWILGTGLSAQVAPLQVLTLVAALQLAYQFLYLTADGDLAHLVAIPLRRAPRISADAATVAQLYHEDRKDEALTLATGVLEQHEDVSLRLWASQIYLERTDFADARTVLGPAFVGRRTLSRTERRDVEAAWAWTLTFAGEIDGAREAVRAAAALRAEYPSWPTFTGIHGAALVAAGKYGDGVALLRAAYDENLEDEDRAHNAAWLAIAASRQGQPDMAEHWMAEAERLDERCYSLAYL